VKVFKEVSASEVQTDDYMAPHTKKQIVELPIEMILQKDIEDVNQSRAYSEVNNYVIPESIKQRSEHGEVNTDKFYKKADQYSSQLVEHQYRQSMNSWILEIPIEVMVNKESRSI
jgi:hypothetical protein